MDYAKSDSAGEACVNKLQIFVVPPSGTSFALSVEPDTTVAALKDDIAAHTGIVVEQQVLSQQGKPMLDQQTLRQLHVQQGSQINVSPALPGGCCECCCTVL
jgi:hypothetical protein